MEKNKNTCVHYSRHKAEFVYKLKTNAPHTVRKTSGSFVGADAYIGPPYHAPCNASVGVGLPDDPPGLVPHPLKKTVIAKPVRTLAVAIRNSRPYRPPCLKGAGTAKP